MYQLAIRCSHFLITRHPLQKLRKKYIIGPVTQSHVCNSTGNFGFLYGAIWSLFLNPNFPIKLDTVYTATSGNEQLVLTLHKEVEKFLAI